MIGSKLGIGYKAATNRFYKLRKQFETPGSPVGETQKGEKEGTEPIMQAEPDFEVEAEVKPEVKPEDEDEDAGNSDRELEDESAEDI